MAVNHIPVDATKTWGQQLVRRRNMLLETIEGLREIQGKMTACIDGTDYSHMEAQFGLGTGKGELVYAELLSLLSKIDSDDSVSHVKAAISQFVNYVG